MRPPRPLRHLAALLALPIACAVPFEALAHGIAHDRERHAAGHASPHAAEHHHDVAAAEAPDHAGAAHEDEPGPELAPAGHEGTHGHPVVRQGTALRLDAAGGVSVVVILPAPPPPPARTELVPPQRTPFARGDPHTGPPPRLRAPPIR